MKVYDIVFISLIILFCIWNIFVAVYSEKVKSYIWSLFYLLPALLTILYIGIFGFEKSLVFLYLAGFIILVGFFYENRKKRIISNTISVVLVLISALWALSYQGYRVPSLYKDFEKGFNQLKEYYCLNEYKAIDYDELYAKYSSLFKEADKEKDEVRYAILWNELISEYHDAHISFKFDTKVAEEAHKVMYGNDYGFSILELCDGSFVAVNVDNESEAYKHGIHNGTGIITMDGKSMTEMKQSVKYTYVPESDIENADFYKSVYIAGLGEDKAIFNFIDDDGNEKEVTLEKRGYYFDRLSDTLTKLDDGAKAGHLTWVNIDDETALFRIKLMLYDNESYGDTDYNQMESEIRDKLLSLKEAGYKNIIIDLRCNGGGSPYMVRSVVKLFDSEGEHFYCAGARLDTKTNKFIMDETTGKYVMDNKITYEGENLWKDGNIYVLVNGQCASGGDHMAYLFGKMNNAKVIGFTKSMGVSQAVNGITLDSGSLSFSSVPTLDENGDILIDAKIGEKADVPLDEKVPLTKEAVIEIFDEEKDYILEYLQNEVME